MKRSLLLLSLILAFAAPLPAVAQDKAPPLEEIKKEPAKPAEKSKADLKKSAEESPPAVAENPALKKWIDAENALIDPLSNKDKESFLILRNKYSIIRVVGIVERDIGEAVKSCGKKNPDMKEKMDSRFKQWQGAVNPIIDTAKKTFEKDINNQKLVDPKEAKKVLKLNDEAYEYSEKQITKLPVSTKEACEGLLSSMNRTEDNMIKLLQKTLLPESAIRAEQEQIEKAKAKSDALKKKDTKADVPKNE
jgi:hypothetical protein